MQSIIIVETLPIAMQNDAISILMPVKNAMPFLKECLDSILAQTYSNWELIAINDHSTDDSFDVLKDYSKNDTRIQCANNKSSGIIEALKLAYTLSTGVLITRMDADDIMMPNKLEVLATSLQKQGKGYLAIGQVTYFSESTLGDGYRSYEQWLNNLAQNGSNFSDLYKECVIPSPCWMVHKSDFDKCNGFENDWYPEDYDLCFRFYEIGLKCIPCNERIHLWRDYSSRTSRTNKNYADNKFTKLKCYYFSKLNRDENTKLVLWGGGKRGKTIAQNLKALHLDFTWACNNPNKIGHQIYDTKLVSTSEIDYNEPIQLIIAVANKEEQTAILTKFKERSLKPMKHYFFFC